MYNVCVCLYDIKREFVENYSLYPRCRFSTSIVEYTSNYEAYTERQKLKCMKLKKNVCGV